jgi:nickel/cobalt transporter (NicO) family protein
MPSFADLVQQGSAHAWLFIPSAILLGALHGLEPGHSKTMMAAFIVAIRGTVGQAVLLGVAATISHTAIVWGIALGGLYFWRGLDAESVEPYFQIASAAIIIGIALWMLWRTRQEHNAAKAADGGHRHDHGDHGHGGEIRRIDTGHGTLVLEIFETGAPPRFRLRSESGAGWAAKHVSLEIERPDGRRQAFSFVGRDGYLESVEEIPEPHQFVVRLQLAHGHHSHDYDVAFIEGDGADHLHEELRGLDVATGGYQDAHEFAHANDIRRRFADRNVTTGQIVMFGLTGGLIPCPASVTVLLLCLQLREFTLGAVLVLCFSIGLAITLVTVGTAAALSVRHATSRFSWFSTFARRAPYFSSMLIICVGLYVGYQGWAGLVR